MRANCLLFGLIVPSLLGQVSSVAFTDSKDVVPAFDSSGAITLPAARLKIDSTYPRGRKERSELTVLYDPKTGHYLWHVAARNPNNSNDTGLYLNVIKKRKSVAFAAPEGLIDFIFGGTIFVKVWQGRAANLDGAVSASINEIQQGLTSAESLGYHRDYKFVPVFGPVLGFDGKIPPTVKPFPDGFACEPNRFAVCPTDNSTIASVSKQDNNWRLVLRNRFDVEVILDQNFDMVSVQQLTQPRQ